MNADLLSVRGAHITEIVDEEHANTSITAAATDDGVVAWIFGGGGIEAWG